VLYQKGEDLVVTGTILAAAAIYTAIIGDGNPVEQLWLNIKQRYLSNMAFKDYEEIVDKCCDAWNDILKKDNETIVINKTKSANCVKDAQRLSRLSDILNQIFIAILVLFEVFAFGNDIHIRLVQ
jgi:hypothetical protein